MIKGKTLALAIGFSLVGGSAYALDISGFGSFLKKENTAGLSKSADKSKDIKKPLYDDKFARAQYDIAVSGDELSESDIHAHIYEQIVMHHPGMTGYWDRKVKFGDAMIYQNHKLYDMERQKYFAVDLADIPVKHTIQKSGDTRTARGGERTTSGLRLSQGRPALDPNGDEIVICRLVEDSRAPYYELAKIDAIRLLKITKSGMTLEEACLDNSLIRQYQATRKGDFIDKMGDKTYPPTTLIR